jgi:hypothetical protein
MADVELGSSIHDNMVNYLSELESHRRITVSRLANTPSTPLFTDNAMSTEHAIALDLPSGFDMLPIIDKVKDPNYADFATYTFDGDSDCPGVPLPAKEISDADAEVLTAPSKGSGMPESSPPPESFRDSL